MDHRDEELHRDIPRIDERPRDTVAAKGDEKDPSVGDQVGEAAGGISGVLAGAAIGSAGGPIGTLIGGIAGAVGGWWAGRAISEAAESFTEKDDEHFRTHYETSENRLADRSYDDVRPAYQVGHLASLNPAYWPQEFEEVEPDLRAGWTEDVSGQYGEWESVRGYARSAYERGRSNRVGQSSEDSNYEQSGLMKSDADLETRG